MSCIAICEESLIRIPGTSSTQGICNAECPSNSNCPSNDLANYMSSFKCTNGFDRVDYKCISTTLQKKSA